MQQNPNTKTEDKKNLQQLTDRSTNTTALT